MDNAVAAKYGSNNNNNNDKQRQQQHISRNTTVWPNMTSSSSSSSCSSSGEKKSWPSRAPSYTALSPISIPVQRGFHPPEPLFEQSYDYTLPEGVEVPAQGTRTDNNIMLPCRDSDYSIDSSVLSSTATTDGNAYPIAASAPVRIPGSVVDTTRIKTPPLLSSPNPKSSSSSLRSRLHRSSTYGARSRRASSIPVSSSSYSNDSSPASQFLGLFATATAPPSQSQPDDPGQQVGRYVLGRSIGYGGCSIVREATTIDQAGQEKVVAVKIVRQNPDCERIQTDFDREISIWKGLNHPNILSLLEVVETDFATFAFIPLVTGGTLYDLLKRQRNGIDIPIALSYISDLSSALLYLHKIVGIVHRDVKLENCLLQPNNSSRMKLILSDFGLSEYITELNVPSYSATPAQTPPRSGSLVHLNEYDLPSSPNMNLSRTSSSARLGFPETSTFRVGDTILGSLPYTAPEVLRELYKKEANEIKTLGDAGINPAIDIWAFGIVLFSLLVGDLPFNHSFAPKLSKMILEAKVDMELVKLKLMNKRNNNNNNNGASSSEPDAILQLLAGCLEPRVAKRWTIDQVYNSKALSFRQ